jgi:hypothetical protein
VLLGTTVLDITSFPTVYQLETTVSMEDNLTFATDSSFI